MLLMVSRWIILLLIYCNLAGGAESLSQLFENIEGTYDNGSNWQVNSLKVVRKGKKLTVVHQCGLLLARPTKKKTHDICEVKLYGEIQSDKAVVELRGDHFRGTLGITKDSLSFDKRPKYECPPLGDIGWPCYDNATYSRATKKPLAN